MEWGLADSPVFPTQQTEQGWRCGGGTGESSLQTEHPFPHGGLGGEEEPGWEPKSPNLLPFSTIPISLRAKQVQPSGSVFSNSL